MLLVGFRKSGAPIVGNRLMFRVGALGFASMAWASEIRLQKNWAQYRL